MNIYDISEKAGVSIATVSRVLNNSPHVSDATRKKVLRVIAQTDYTPNAFARSLGLGSMKTVGLLCPDPSDPYQASALSFLESAFRRRDYNCLLTCTGSTADARGQSILEMRHRKVDGMVLMGSAFADMNTIGRSRLEDSAAVMPVLLLNFVTDVPHCYSVCCDDELAMHDAAEHLIRSGCRNILYLNHADNYSGRCKQRGYLSALQEAGIRPDERLQHLVTRRDTESVQKLLTDITRQGIAFDAVLTTEDGLGVAAVKYAVRHGLRLPQDISVIGYNNIGICEYCEPELSSVDVHLQEACERIVQTMMTALAGDEAPARQLIAGSLVHRGSTKPLL